MAIPRYKVVFDEDNEELGIDLISLVDRPAIEVDFVRLAKQVRMAVDVDRQIVTGPVLIPDMPIYRKDFGGLAECEIVFDRDVIARMAAQFAKKSRTAAINLEHSEEMVDAYVLEMWIIEDPEKDKSAVLGFDLPAGTMMVSAKIEDKAFWANMVKGGVVNGFSIEGSIALDPVAMAKQKLKNDMDKNKRPAKVAFTVSTKLEKDFELPDGTVIYTPGEDFAVGEELFVIDADGNKIKAEDGEYNLGELVIRVAEGKISEVVEKEVEAAADPEAAPEASTEPAATDPDVDTPDMAADYKAFKAEIVAAIAELTAKLNDLWAAENDKTAESTVNEEITNLKKQVMELSKAPGATSSTATAAPVSPVEAAKLAREREIQERLAGLAKLKESSTPK